MTKGKLAPLWKLCRVGKKGMSFERVANVVDIYLNRLPFLETLHEQISRAVSRKENDYLDNLIFTLEEEVKIIKEE